MNDSANSPCHEKCIDIYHRYILNGYDQIVFSADVVQNAFCKLHLNKTGDLDELSGNHLKFDLLLIFCYKHAVNFFNLCMKYAYVPNNFTSNSIFPVFKSQTLDKASVEFYRPVSLCSLFSKWFELCILSKCEMYFVPNEHQYGFTKGRGMQKALLTIRVIIEYHNRQDTPVYVASLDASKAFDKINHYGLFISLIKRKVPALLLNVLINWHLRLSGVVRWQVLCFM